ncbi:MAG: agmatine deiminase [Acidobacteria bacterium]|nr:MAG: agmatine deiminase [Acidobacteriota bacterium]
MKVRSSVAPETVALRYRMPAEWEPHESTWLAWPHYRNDWPGKFEPIPWVYAEIIRHLTPHERVDLIVNDAASEKRARKTLKQANAFSENIRFHRWPTDRVWTRDSGCTFVDCGAGALARESREAQQSGYGDAVRKKKEPSAPVDTLGAIKWGFNAWAKYPNWRKDEKIGSLMARTAGVKEVHPTFGPTFGKDRVVLEGGSIDVNGQGTLLTTEECLLSKVQQRNPGMKREDYEETFADYLGIKKVIWLGSGITGDDTHGHVDDITRFVAPDTIVTMTESNPRDSNYQPLQENLRRLKSSTDQDGNPFQIIQLPMPSPLVFEGRRLPGSYGNFYIANSVVLVPVFNDPNDRIALNILADLFPAREIVGIYSGDLIWGFGAMHCMTQQQPSSWS